MNYLLPKELLQKICDYYAQKPWVEANPYLAALSKLQPAPEASKAAPELQVANSENK